MVSVPAPPALSPPPPGPSRLWELSSTSTCVRFFCKEDGLFSLLYVFTHSLLYVFIHISMDLVYFTLWVIILSYFYFACTRSSLQREGFSCCCAWISYPMACGILVSRPGIEPVSSALEGGFLTTEPAGMSLIFCFVAQILPASASGSSFRLVAMALSISPCFCSGHFFILCCYEILQA